MPRARRSTVNIPARQVKGNTMADARRMGKSELFSSFAEKFEVKRTQARDYFDFLTGKRSATCVCRGRIPYPTPPSAYASERAAR